MSHFPLSRRRVIGAAAALGLGFSGLAADAQS